MASDGTWGDEITTLMMRHVPVAYSQDQLRDEVADVLGNSNDFDFLYLPWDSNKAANCGFAFINFVNAALARRYAKILNGHMCDGAKKPLEVAPARIQGAAGNVVSLISRMMSGAVRNSPVVILQGRKVRLAELAPPSPDLQRAAEISQKPTGARVENPRATRQKDIPPGGQSSGGIAVAAAACDASGSRGFCIGKETGVGQAAPRVSQARPRPHEDGDLRQVAVEPPPGLPMPAGMSMWPAAPRIIRCPDPDLALRHKLLEMLRF